MEKKHNNKSLAEQTVSLLRMIVRTEFSTDAGRINMISFVVLVVMGLLVFIPDALITLVNIILIVFNKSLPQLPDWSKGLYLVGIPLFLAWCVYIVQKGESKVTN